MLIIIIFILFLSSYSNLSYSQYILNLFFKVLVTPPNLVMLFNEHTFYSSIQSLRTSSSISLVSFFLKNYIFISFEALISLSSFPNFLENSSKLCTYIKKTDLNRTLGRCKKFTKPIRIYWLPSLFLYHPSF